MSETERPKVLIVDDQPRNLDVLEVMLGDADCTLIRATSAEEALLCVVRHEFAALEHANQELERRVQERTAALTRAHQGVRENEERLRMALDVAQIAAWEWHLASGQMRWSTDPEVLFGFPRGSFGSELRTVRVAH